MFPCNTRHIASYCCVKTICLCKNMADLISAGTLQINAISSGSISVSCCCYDLIISPVSCWLLISLWLSFLYEAFFVCVYVLDWIILFLVCLSVCLLVCLAVSPSFFLFLCCLTLYLRALQSIRLFLGSPYIPRTTSCAFNFTFASFDFQNDVCV